MTERGLPGPNLGGTVGKIGRGLYDERRKLVAVGRRGRLRYVSKFNLAGALIAGAESSYDMVHEDSILVYVQFALRTAGTSGTTLQLFVDDALALERTMATGVKFQGEAVALPFARFSTTAWWKVLTAGSGAAHLTVFHEFKLAV